MNKRKELLFYYGVGLWVVLSLVLLIFQNWSRGFEISKVRGCLLESLAWAVGACFISVMAKIFFEAVQKKRNTIIILFGFIALMLLIDYYAAFRAFFSAGYLVGYFLSILVCASIGGITVLIVKKKKTLVQC